MSQTWLASLFAPIVDAFDATQGWVFRYAVQPLVHALGFEPWLEDAHDATAWLLMGLIQLAFMLIVIRSLERWRPVERVVDPGAVRDDVVYTLIHRLGFFRLAMFFTFTPVMEWLTGLLRMQGFSPWHVDALWPGVTDRAWVSLLMYLVIFDFVDYVIHRMQHGLNWWWQLHALHHSQRQMTMWSDNRNHLLDDVLRDGVIVTVALVIGVAPAQFMAIVAMTMLVESFSHANVRLGFGPMFGRLLVSPAFHRYHHTIGVGHESAGKGTLGGHNFAVLFPVWDLLFGTARLSTPPEPTGIRDQLPGEGARNYGRGFWQQQWFGVLRLVGRA